MPLIPALRRQTTQAEAEVLGQTEGRVIGTQYGPLQDSSLQE